MLDLSDLDLAAEPNARHVEKLPLAVTVRFATAPGTLRTREGEVRFRPGDALITDTATGDAWPVVRRRFLQTYEASGGQAPGEAGPYVKRPLLATALRIEQPFFVRLHLKRGRLDGQAGDWLLQYAPGELGVVAADAFARTYRFTD